MKRLLVISVATAKLSLISAICVMSLSGCQKDLYDPSANGNDGKTTLENYFDFATTRSVQLKVDYGTNGQKAYFEVYAENPFEVKEGQVVRRTGLIALASGFTDENGVYNKKASITASVSQLYVYSPDFGVPKLFATQVVGETVNATITFENAMDLSEMVPVRTATRATSEDIAKYIPYTLGGWNETGKPKYYDSNYKIKVDTKLKSYITSQFPEGGDNSKSTFITENADILVTEKANVWISYFGGQTDGKSVFAYYCYSNGATKSEIEAASKKACVVFPNANGEALGNYSGVGVKLNYITPEGKLIEAFPAGTRIGFLLWNNGWNNGNSTFVKDTFYSTKSLNTDNRSHTAVFGGTDGAGKKYNIITMEDWGDNDYNDVAFAIASNPIEAINTDPAPDPAERKGTDQYRGLLGFEDSWPNKGDYDMNDVVLKYASGVDYNIRNEVISIIDKFTLSWTGADFHNGFAYEVPYDLTGAKVTINGKIASGSISGKVITLFADARAELGVSNVPALSMPEEVQEAVYTVSIIFAQPTLDKSMVVPPYNPFIKIRNSTIEVHLTDKAPSSSASNEFPSGSDVSDGTNGRFFISEDGYPFAIHMDARVDKTIMDLNLKKEAVSIDKTYSGFAEWAKTRDAQIKWW